MKRQLDPNPRSRFDGELSSAWCPEVRAAFADGIAIGLGVPVTSLPMLTDAQLWQGFRAAVDSKKTHIGTPLCKMLNMGEHFAVSLGVSLHTQNFPTGGCLSETMESVGVDQTSCDAAIAFRVTKAIKAPPDPRPLDVQVEELMTMVSEIEKSSKINPLTEAERARFDARLIDSCWAF